MDDKPLTDEEIAVLRAAGWRVAGGGNINGDGVIRLRFRKDGKIATSTRAEWRAIIADLSRPPDLSYERLEELLDRMIAQRDALLVVAEVTLHDYEAGGLSDEDRALRIEAIRNVIESCRSDRPAD